MVVDSKSIGRVTCAYPTADISRKDKKIRYFIILNLRMLENNPGFVASIVIEFRNPAGKVRI